LIQFEIRLEKKQVANPSANPPVAATNGTSGMMAIYSRHWGPERSVQILRDPTKSLGISIVGGKVYSYSNINSRVSEAQKLTLISLLCVAPEHGATTPGRCGIGKWCAHYRHFHQERFA
jgi:phosphoribosylformylglycinamidine (FGAM) synthase-like enzyme